VNYFHPQRLFENIEIAVAVQQSVACLDAESGNQTIDGSSYGVTLALHTAVVLRGFYSYFLSAILARTQIPRFARDDNVQKNIESER